MTRPIDRIAVVGGDTSAWIAAAALTKGLRGERVDILVVERDSVLDRYAENFVPSLLSFLKFLNIDQRDFMRETGAFPSLGTAYEDWSAAGQDFIHTFGAYGSMLDGIEFQHFAAKARAAGDVSPFDEYSVGAMAARFGRFAHPVSDPRSILSRMAYSLNVDSRKFRRYLKSYALRKGVRLIAAEVVSATLDSASGFVESLELDTGEIIGADFFFDGSNGSEGAISECLGEPMEDWSEWLPFDRRVSVRLDRRSPLLPHVTLRAMDAGWHRRIPLRDAVISELHYHSEITPESVAADALRSVAGAAPDQDVLHSSIRHACRRAFWHNNCVAVGVAAGDAADFVINRNHLAQSAMLRWIDRYPDRDCASSVVWDYNRACRNEYSRILDVHVLNLTSVGTGATEFWQRIKRISKPESLEHKLELFLGRGSLAFYEGESLLPNSWVALLIGLGYWPNRYHPLADADDARYVKEKLADIRRQVREAALQLPDQQEHWNRYVGLETG